MAKKPKKLRKASDSATTAKLKVSLYNYLVSVRETAESISDVIERLINRKKEVPVEEHENCSLSNKEGL